MEIRTLGLAKAGHVYLLTYAPGQEEEVIEEVMRLAEDQLVDFDWQDAACWGMGVTQLAAASCKRARATSTGPGLDTPTGELYG
jgi:hypothetical protein